MLLFFHGFAITHIDQTTSNRPEKATAIIHCVLDSLRLGLVSVLGLSSLLMVLHPRCRQQVLEFHRTTC